jgi:hypothetical protein
MGNLTRRHFIATTVTSTAAVAMPYVRGSHAAGKLTIGFWDHWVPGANDTSRTLVEEWAAKEKVDVQIDYITSQGNKLLLTIAAEAQARSGHDILAMATWLPHANDSNLEPVDDVMESLINQNGAVNPTVEYLGKANGHWLAVPATSGSQMKGPCSRIDLLKQYAKLSKFFPADAPAWDDASNNKWLISGKGALIMNPPSAWHLRHLGVPGWHRERRHSARRQCLAVHAPDSHHCRNLYPARHQSAG